MEYGLFATLVLLADIYAIFNIFSSRASGLAKVLWTVGVVIFPVLGFIAWLIAGPRNATLRI